MTEEKYNDSYDTERNHMETILNNRFNFLLVSVGLFVNAAIQASSVTNYQWLLIICFIYTFTLSLTLFRAQARLNYLVDTMSKLEGHPIGETKSALDKRKNFFINRSVRNLIGFYIPIFTMLLLIFLILFPSFVYCS